MDQGLIKVEDEEVVLGVSRKCYGQVEKPSLVHRRCVYGFNTGDLGDSAFEGLLNTCA